MTDAGRQPDDGPPTPATPAASDRWPGPTEAAAPEDLTVHAVCLGLLLFVLYAMHRGWLY